MFLQFFTSLRDAQVPVTLREYLTLMEALDADLAGQTVENFYYLSRATLVKDERNSQTRMESIPMAMASPDLARSSRTAGQL
jgi:uncharacterized protein with von Willebrand factor type A (vWA) domain